MLDRSHLLARSTAQEPTELAEQSLHLSKSHKKHMLEINFGIDSITHAFDPRTYAISIAFEARSNNLTAQENT